MAFRLQAVKVTSSRVKRPYSLAEFAAMIQQMPGLFPPGNLRHKTLLIQQGQIPISREAMGRLLPGQGCEELEACFKPKQSK